MYSHHEIADRIRQRAKYQNMTIKALLSDCNLSINTISQLDKNGKTPSCISLAKIADALGCSMDYLMGRTESPEIYHSPLENPEGK